MTFHCDRCEREWETETPVHFHRCIERFAGDDVLPRRLPLDPVARGAYWRALLEPADPEGETHDHRH